MPSACSKYPEVVALIPKGEFTVDDLPADALKAAKVLRQLADSCYLRKIGKVDAPRPGMSGRRLTKYEARPEFWKVRTRWVG
jgi:hypothetical protein